MIADGFFMLMVYLGMVHFFRSSHYSNLPLVIWWIYPLFIRGLKGS